MIKFEVLGQCFGKGRPRFKKVGNFVQTYSDAKTTNYENLVKLSYINSGCEPYLNGEALICEMIVYYPIPKSTSKKKTIDMLNRKIFPTKKPDIDNVVKSILDALNKVAFTDDTQVVELHCYKFYGTEPKVEVTIKEIDYDK